MNIPINPEILTWARERSNLSVPILAQRMKKDPSEIESWEKGISSPSYGQLEDLAYKHLKIPLAVFFFPSIPDIEDPVGKFRRLPDYEITRLSDDTLKKIRLAQAYQDSLAIIAKDYSSTKIFKDIKPRNTSATLLANEARKYLNISLEEQFSFQSTRVAFKRWRYVLEKCGIFTFKDTFKDKYISGFCLNNEEYPIIFINNSNSFSKQIFTLMHELGHILLGLYGVTDMDETYFTYLSTTERNAEIFCNEFASQMLVPDKKFEKAIASYKQNGIDIVSDIASKYSVSREVYFENFLTIK